MNLWHRINPITKRGINCIIEIPSGSTKKYELDKFSGKFILSRATFPILKYNYGFIPRTLADDNDPLDVLVLGKKRSRGSIVECRVIAVLKMQDEKSWDNKILAVPINDMDLNYIKNVKDVLKSVLIDIKGFFRHYKDKYNKKTKVFKWLPCSKALLEIRKSMNNYRKLKNVL